MTLRRIASPAVLASGVLLLLILIIYALSVDDPLGPALRIAPKPTGPLSPAPTSLRPVDPLHEDLVRSGWEPSAAAAVLDLNADWFAVLEAENSAARGRQIELLQRLGHFRTMMPLLRSCPEAAGLIANSRDPQATADVLDRGDADQRQFLLGLYMLHPGRDESAQLSAALHGPNADLVRRLWRHGLAGVEALFMFPRKSEADREYERWLQETLTQRAAVGDDDDLASFVVLAAHHGEGIRRRLNANGEFLSRFRVDLWPKLSRVALSPGNALELFLDDPAVWDLLMRPDGEELLLKRGMLAVALLFGRDAFPVDLHVAVSRILLAGDGRTASGLIEGTFRMEPVFLTLLRRGLPSDLLAAVVRQLLEAGADFAKPLHRFANMSLELIAEAVGPVSSSWAEWLPLYAQLSLGRKLFLGDEITAADWIEVTVDTAALFVPVPGVGKVASQTTKAIVKVSERAIVKAALRRLAASVVRQTVGSKFKKEIARWGAAAILAEAREAGRRLSRHAAVDVTGAVQVLFREGHLGRAAFRRITSLEARVFMRQDARVFIHVERVATKGAVGYLKGAVKEAVGGECERAFAEASPRDWQRHAAAWWLMGDDETILEKP